MDDALKRLTEQEKDIDFVGTTVAQTEQLLRDLEMLDTQAQVRKKVTEHAQRRPIESQRTF